MFSLFPLITAGVVSWIVLNQIFSKKPPKSVEEQLGEALGKYLKDGIKVKMEALESGKK
ncbi:MAG: hypothetical protein ACO3EZ_00985 [Prochlorotrichaceae cyanobacterium]|jgi:hypothetical protein